MTQIMYKSENPHRTHYLKLLLVLIASASVSFMLCANAAVRSSAGHGTQSIPWSVSSGEISMVRLEQGYIRRFRLQLPQGECVVLKPAIQFLSLQDEQDQLMGDPNTPEDDIEKHQEDPDSRWYAADRSELTTFNCATYALGRSIGLSKSDWLEPAGTNWTDGRSPAAAVLHNYYEWLATYPVSDPAWKTLESSSLFRRGDVVAFVGNKQGEFVHFGRIAMLHGRRTLVSKMGSGPIVRGTVHQTARNLRVPVTEVRVYRLRVSSTRQSAPEAGS